MIASDTGGVATVLRILKERGLSLAFGDDGQPRLSGPKEEMTPSLVDALKAWRREIIEHLRATLPRRKVFLWRDGHLYTQPTDEAANVPPTGAWWYRMEGETAWRLVEGREQYAAGHSPPEVP